MRGERHPHGRATWRRDCRQLQLIGEKIAATIASMIAPDIFLSFASEDRPRIDPLVGTLERHGWRVFRVPLPLSGFAGWHDDDIDRALNEAACIVVLWSEKSTKSKLVLREAERGRDRHVLVSAYIDEVLPPITYQEFRSIDLTDLWSTEPSRGLDLLIAAIEDVINKSPNI